MAMTVAVLLAACSKEKFTVEGTITNAKDSVLYFENMSLEGPVAIDSVVLAEDGQFEFKADAQSVPEFYRLRIAGQIINISADSTETVSVKAQYPDMSWKYEVSGSENCSKIRELALLQIELQNRCIRISRDPNMGMQQSADSITKVINTYKENIKNQYIIAAPMKPYAYFALFQTVGGQLVFNPRANKDDVKMFSAVATSWDTFYPGSERGLNLHNIALEGQRTQRILDSRNEGLTIEASKVNVTNMIDLSLLDNNGKEVKLSSLKGHIILLDYHMYGMQNSMQRIMALRDLYNKYHGRGLEIYQVGEDENEHFWKTSVAALPWKCVYDATGSAGRTYNVQELPCGFLLNRECTAVLRYNTLEGLEAEILKQL